MRGPAELPSRGLVDLGYRPETVKRGGGGGKGGVSPHTTVGDTNDRRHPAPPGYGLTQYARRFFNNIIPLRSFIGATNFDPTHNRTDDPPSVRDPVPWSRRWYSPTFHPKFDPRLWTVYRAKEEFQITRGMAPRVLPEQPRMSRPFPNRLTIYRRYPPYSEQTKILGGRRRR